MQWKGRFNGMRLNWLLIERINHTTNYTVLGDETQGLMLKLQQFLDLIRLGMQTTELQTDVVVLGSGPGGYTAAFRAADLGKKVVLI